MASSSRYHTSRAYQLSNSQLKWLIKWMKKSPFLALILFCIIHNDSLMQGAVHFTVSFCNWICALWARNISAIYKSLICSHWNIQTLVFQIFIVWIKNFTIFYRLFYFMILITRYRNSIQISLTLHWYTKEFSFYKKHSF